MKKVTSKAVMVQSPSISLSATRLAFTAAALSLVLIAVLHFLEPEYDPSWRFLSEYSNGKFGWVMKIAFFNMALSCAVLFSVLKSQIQTIGGKVGLGFLLATFVGLTMGGLFNIDPITASPDQLTAHGNLHGLASMIGIPSLPVAAMIISVSLARSQAWLPARASLLLTANLTWISLVVMFLTIGIMLPRAGGFGPDVWIGWPNRFLMLTYGMWLMAVAWQAEKLRGQKS
jgi:hypothetical protein